MNYAILSLPNSGIYEKIALVDNLTVWAIESVGDFRYASYTNPNPTIRDVHG